MAAIKSRGFYTPQPTPGDGRAIVVWDQATVSANPTIGDTVDFLIPAGFEVHKAWLTMPDMDTNGAPTLAGKVGYLKQENGSTLTESDAYFRADGALGQSAAVLDLDFAPKKFNEDTRLSITWTAVSATFAAGTIRLVMLGASKGVN